MNVSTRIELVELVSQRVTFEEICEIADSGLCCTFRATLTPDVCRSLVEERNTKNRGLKRHQKDFLKQEMESGEFAFNGEPIIMGLGGGVLDGQHRLVAAAEQGVSIDVLMVFGIEDKLFVKIDTGSGRSNADALHVDGKKHVTLMAAALRHVDNYETSQVMGDKASRRASGKVSNAEILRLAKGHRKIEASVKRADAFFKKCRGLTPPSIVAALHYLFSSVDPTLTEEFISIVEDGCLPNKKYDSTLAEAAMKLKRVLENSTRGPRKADAVTLAACWIKAWNAFQEDDVPQVFHFRSGERFPQIAGL
jgi:hypothetical protein